MSDERTKALEEAIAVVEGFHHIAVVHDWDAALATMLQALRALASALAETSRQERQGSMSDERNAALEEISAMLEDAKTSLDLDENLLAWASVDEALRNIRALASAPAPEQDIKWLVEAAAAWVSLVEAVLNDPKAETDDQLALVECLQYETLKSALVLFQEKA